PIKLKKYFYLLRALLASVWVKLHNTPIPVKMLEMAELLTKDELLELELLIQIKIQAPENYAHTLSPILKNLITRLWQLSDELAFKEIKQGDVRKLNDLLKRTVENLC
ncbi:MAG: nucleotidyltransferase domain-containing protein, partial [Moraxella sp.]|nr:nucleotidyltransferase domain-containing protein [Moraxella sp.]